VFELSPELYLFQQPEGQKCQFGVYENKLKGASGEQFIIGDLMLRHLYQIYDYEKEQIGLGVNTHSAGKLLMYAPGRRPSE